MSGDFSKLATLKNATISHGVSNSKNANLINENKQIFNMQSKKKDDNYLSISSSNILPPTPTNINNNINSNSGDISGNRQKRSSPMPPPPPPIFTTSQLRNGDIKIEDNKNIDGIFTATFG